MTTDEVDAVRERRRDLWKNLANGARRPRQVDNDALPADACDLSGENRCGHVAQRDGTHHFADAWKFLVED